MADREPVVSVIVPARNAENTISAQLQALGRQIGAPSHEVIVVDNGSSDATPAIVSQFARDDDRIRLVQATSGRGVNVARHAGACEANGSLLVYCDADDVVDDRWVQEMARALKTHDLAAGRIDEHELNRETPTRYRTPVMLDLPALDISPLPFVPGCAFGIRRAVLDAVGGWDVAYPATVGGDDIDLSWRCQLAGYRTAFVPTAVVHYRYRRTLCEVAAQSFRYGKSIPTIFARFRDAGCVRRPWGLVRRDIFWILGALPRASLDSQFRLHWVRRAAFLAGRFVTCAQRRILCL